VASGALAWEKPPETVLTTPFRGATGQSAAESAAQAEPVDAIGSNPLVQRAEKT